MPNYVDKTRYALVQRREFTASGRDEIVARTQYRRDIIWGLLRWLDIRLKRDGYAIYDLHKPHPPKKGEVGYKLTRDEIADFAHRWDARIEAGRIPG